MAKRKADFDQDLYDTNALEMEEMLYARHAEIENLKALTQQRGTPIPSLFSNFYKFIQNPSAISVETFKRMVDTDDTIGSGVDFLTTCLAARIGRYKHPSKEITEWVNARLDEIEGGWNNKVKEIHSASWVGFYTGEKVWANTENGFVPEKIVPLPPTTILFEVDRTGCLTEDGVLQYQRNWAPMGQSFGSGMFGGDMVGTGFNNANPDAFAKMGDLPFPMRSANTLNYLSIRIPKRKVMHYAFDAQGKFDNPYGRSLLRRCYKYYVFKDFVLRTLATALDRKGTPMLAVYYDPNTTLKDPKKVGGTSARGRDVGQSIEKAMQEIFKDPHNDSVFLLPGKKDQYISVNSISQEFNGDIFLKAWEACDRAIYRALLIPSLIFGAGDQGGGGAFALGKEHSKTWDKLLDGTNAGALQVIREQLIKEMLAYNFPKSAWQKDGLGEFTQRELSTEERQMEVAIAEVAVNMGAVDINDLNDLNEVRQKAGFSERETPIPQVDAFGLGMEEGDGNGTEEGGNAGGVRRPKPADGDPKGQRKVDDAGRAPKPGGSPTRRRAKRAPRRDRD